jgi:flavin-dependent dehydrogenase
MTASAETQSVHCAIAGGGPAGMMLGFLLARAGVSVMVLEKHADFLRDFRGDTIHPSTPSGRTLPFPELARRTTARRRHRK